MLTKPRPPAKPHVFRVLLVERSVAGTRVLRESLQRDGLRVHGARSAEEAARLAAGDGFDAVIAAAALWKKLSAALANHPGSSDLCVLLVTDGELPEHRLGTPAGVHAVIARSALMEAEGAHALIAGAITEHRGGRRKQTMVRWLEREARTDHLTGLYNRHAFDEHLATCLGECAERGQPVTVVVLDVAGTQTVNEAHGHDVGDAMIRRAATGIARCIRGGDFAARVGGDDFAIVIPGGDLEVGRLMARRIGHEIERLNDSEWDGEIPVSVTFGVASGTGCTAEELFEAAEQQIDRRRPAHAPILFESRRFDPEGPYVA
ncbi:MAG: diguanylate cyclase [Chloroflexi bacterium]|nr:diguanylate cyclase [Chloroflexota bacterium]